MAKDLIRNNAKSAQTLPDHWKDGIFSNKEAEITLILKKEMKNYKTTADQ